MSNKKKSENKKTYEALTQNVQWLPYTPYSSTQFIDNQWWTAGYGYAGPSPYSLAARYDDGSGMLRPVYLTTFQKKQITDEARQLVYFNEYCAAVVKIMQDFVIGTGFEYRITPVREGVNDKLIQQTQEFLDLVLETNNISEFENELVWRLLVEGECIVRNFPQSDGMTIYRVIEPELLRSNNDTNDPDLSFGIQCRKDDIHDIVGYWIVERPWEGLNSILVPQQDINYVKINGTSNTKRGLPMSFAVSDNFKNCESVLLSMITLANSRAKVAMVRKVADAPPEAVTALRDENTDVILNDPVTNQKLNIERIAYGSILTASQNISYEFPDIGSFADETIAVLQQNIRAICAHYGISEIQMSANPSNSNYASSIVAESPSHKNFVRWQKLVGEFIAGRRTKPNQSMLWKALTHAVKRGLLPSNAITDLKITYKGPSVVTRDQHEEAQSNKIYYDMGIKSGEAIASEIGLNYTEQKSHKKQDDDLSEILKTVTQIKQAGIPSEAAKELFKKYHPTVEDAIINSMFESMEISKGANVEIQKPEAPAEEKPAEKTTRKAKVPRPPKP